MNEGDPQDILDRSSRLVHTSDLDFWFKVFESHQVTMSFSRHLSELVAVFCLHNEVDAMTFSKLTQAKHLPEISADVALTLIDLERRIIAPNQYFLLDLVKRCVAGMRSDWKKSSAVRRKEFCPHPDAKLYCFERNPYGNLGSCSIGKQPFGIFGRKARRAGTRSSMFSPVGQQLPSRFFDLLCQLRHF